MSAKCHLSIKKTPFLLIAFIVIYEIIRFFLKNTQKYLTSLHQ